MTTYEKKTNIFNEEYIERIADDIVSVIPTDPANSDYQAYLKSLEDEAASL